MNKNIVIIAAAFSIMASCTGKTTSSNTEDQSLDSIMAATINREFHSDSAKVIYYVVDDNAYRSEFYNTTQAIVRESMNVPSLARNYQKFQISYFCKDEYPTMDVLQSVMGELMKNPDFWDTVGSDPLMDDLRYLAIDTKYEKLYHPYTSKENLVDFKTQYEKYHHIISQGEFDRLPLDK